MKNLCKKFFVIMLILGVINAHSCFAARADFAGGAANWRLKMCGILTAGCLTAGIQYYFGGPIGPILASQVVECPEAPEYESFLKPFGQLDIDEVYYERGDLALRVVREKYAHLNHEFSRFRCSGAYNSMLDEFEEELKDSEAMKDIEKMIMFAPIFFEAAWRGDSKLVRAYVDVYPRWFDMVYREKGTFCYSPRVDDSMTHVRDGVSALELALFNERAEVVDILTADCLPHCQIMSGRLSELEFGFTWQPNSDERAS